MKDCCMQRILKISESVDVGEKKTKFNIKHAEISSQLCIVLCGLATKYLLE